jgi:predicted ATP-grasp superfamily ATP-dependent carboligase
VNGLTRRFMRAIGYRGVLDIGYRYDARDGQYKVLDVNPRIGATFRLFVAPSGLDVARALYLDMTGQPIPPAEHPDGRKWIVEDCDVVSCVRYAIDGKLRFGQWLKSLRGIDEGALWATDDPWPFVGMLAADVRDGVRRVFTRRAAGEAQPAASWAKVW